ncbi:MAG: hypothetical protein R2862_06630 [Thermoanaerobaculia bacterium]
MTLPGKAAVLAGALVAGAASTLAAQVLWLGPEIVVNSTTAGSQFAPAIASGPEGDFVAAWQSAGADGSGSAVRARLFDSGGSPASGEIALNATTADDQVTPAVARTEDGGFVAAWASNGQDGSGYAIVARRFGAGGAPLGGEIVVNVTTAGNQIAPRIAANAAGFLVVWTGPGASTDTNEVFVRRYQADGTPATGEIRMNATVTGQQISPDVDFLPGNGFLATWASEGQDGSGYAVVARRFDAAGGAVSPEIAVPTVTTYDQSSPAIATLADGSFVVAWQKSRQANPLPVGPQPVVSFRHFDTFGTPLGGEIDAVNDSARRAEVPALAADADGGFTLAWKRSDPISGEKDALAARFEASGAPLSGVFVLNTTVTGDQIDPVVSAAATPGRFNAAWAGFGQDGSSYAIVAQRFGAPVEPCVADAKTLCLNDGRFSVRARWATAAGATGAGDAVGLTSDSGYFWFFDQENVELVIKVLDACGLAGFENFWVFATGLTNVDVTLTVLDTATGESRIYRNPLDQDFQPILDTSHLHVCGAAAAPAASAPPPAPPRTALAPETACVPGPATLCLQGGRFEVTIDWQTAAGATGPGQAVPLTDDSGYFWFFDDANVELVLKVLDGCGTNDRYWVFAGGLTNVGTHLLVRDTADPTATFERVTPVNTPFPPILSIEAFATCP